MTIWGILTCVMAVIHDFSHLVVLRVFVGVVESGFAPGILLIISSWYKREEQSKRFAVFMSAAILSGAFGGLLAGAITGGLEGAKGLRGWRWLFIVEGAATIVVAIIAFFILLDFPGNSKGLTERERSIAIARLQEGGVMTRSEGEERIGKLQCFRMAITDWRVIGFILGYMVSFLPQNSHAQAVLTQEKGHRRLLNPLLLLPNPRPRPRLHEHRPSSIHDRPYLRRRIRLHCHNRLLR